MLSRPFLHSLCLLFFTTNLTLAQWSTSTRAESTLYVCPGFYPGIVTFDDGSSIVLGALYHSIYARKLDEYGYYQWTPPVLVHYHDSSAITETIAIGDWGGWISDGDGGVILFWYDHRGAYDTGTEFANNAIYVQRVDRFGMIRWTPGGVLLNAPPSGRKRAGIVNDGQGGFFLAWTERGFGYPNAPNKHYLRAAHYNQNVIRTWETAIDSSTVQSDSYSLNYLLKGGQRVYMGYYANGNYTRVIDLQGSILTPERGPAYYITAERDSVIYQKDFSPQNNAIKLGSTGDTIWVSSFNLPDTCQGIGGYLLADYKGGVYFMKICRDTIVYIDSVGTATRRGFPGIGFGGKGFHDGNHGIVLASSTTAKRFNESGVMIWPSPVIYLQDPSNAYFPLYVPDKNGGIISVFWTTRGGIFAQHTGRNGEVGVITTLHEVVYEPHDFRLNQNFPNPFNTSTFITYSLSKGSNVKLEILDVLGRKVVTLINQVQGPGFYSVTVDANQWPSGLYFYRIKADNYIIDAKKMLLLK